MTSQRALTPLAKLTQRGCTVVYCDPVIFDFAAEIRDTPHHGGYLAESGLKKEKSPVFRYFRLFFKHDKLRAGWVERHVLNRLIRIAHDKIDWSRPLEELKIRLGGPVAPAGMGMH